MQFVPILNSLAGASLTLANWEETNTKIAAFYLNDLLIKPGLAVLQSLKSLKEYLAWPHQLVLNLSLLKLNKAEEVSLRSPYDGSLIKIAKADLFKLLKNLDADFFILPEGFDELELPSKISNYFSYDKKTGFSEFYEKIKISKAELTYVAGNFDLDELNQLKKIGPIWVESNSPSDSAIHGHIYDDKQDFLISKSDMAEQYEPLSKACGCPTCQAGFTRAYLHHLYSQTPLLCQRYLLQHNIFQMNLFQSN